MIYNFFVSQLNMMLEYIAFCSIVGIGWIVYKKYYKRSLRTDVSFMDIV